MKSLAIAGLLLAGAVHAAPPTQNVEVVNTPAVTIANTPAVTVSGTAAVSVTNTPTVNVGNTPSVNVASMPAVQLANNSHVTIANTAVPVVDTNHKDPFLAALGVFTNGTTSGSGSFTVPANKRAVIEFISVSGDTGGDAEVRISTGVVNFGNGTGYIYVPVQKALFGLRGSMMTKLYAMPGVEVTCIVNLPQASQNYFNCNMSGYLEDP